MPHSSPTRTYDGRFSRFSMVLFDDTFRTNDIDIPFELANEEFMPGEGLQLRLETDQVRDWHKPNTQWTMTAPTE